MLHRSKTKDSKGSTPGPTFFSSDQVADYLTGLRSNNVQRPSGSRPLPSLGLPSRRDSQAAHISSKSFDAREARLGGSLRCPSAASHRSSNSTTSTDSATNSYAGRPLVRQPQPSVIDRDSSSSTSGSAPSIASDELSALAYRENGLRWMERQEARSLRQALEDKDFQDEEHLHAVAQDEASKLIWMHQNPGKLPRDPHAPYNYKHHLQKGSHARSYSLGQDIPTISPNTIGSIPTLHKSTARSSSVSPTRGEYVSPDSSPEKKSHHSWDSPEKKAYVKLATRNMSPERTFQASYIQGGPNGNVARGIFRNPRDCIYEEPETSADERIGRGGRLRSSVALNAKPNDPSPKTSSNVDAYLGRGYSPVKGIEKFSSVEIHKNPPTQSRNPAYTSNSLPPTPPDSATASDNDGHGIADEGEEEEKYAPRKDGIEIRGDDIRAATSMRLKDRSPRLPMPTVVSNKPGRHIVSFNKDWKPLQEFQGDHSEERRSDLLRTNLTGSRALPDPPSKPSPPRSIQSAPVIPTINLPEEPSSARGNSSTKPPIPTINVPDAPTITFDGPSKAPSINVSSSESGGPRSRPLPKTHGFPSRPLPFHSSTAPASSYHVTPTIRRPTAACSQCGMSIQGRTVSAGGFRFHPECFRCYNCGEGLECVAFYPEPDPKRAERLNRIRRRAKGEHIEHEEGKTKADDGEDAPRFYCHLDYHEFFSPRCRSCKTPIEGEVVVACGGEWHVGHFFCAECGDPFDPSTPFVEKDGYAWCVNCHTNRYSTRCRKCRKPVTDMVVKALGSEWHAQCFCCTECDAQFDDGRYFLRGPSKDPVCVACEERRLKA